MKRISTTQIITLMVTLLTITINALANILPLNGLNTGEISDRFDILFVPAGYVFSIWGLIYLALILYSLYQLMPSQKDNPLLNKIAPAYWISGLANSIWIFLWHYEIFSITWIAMLTILASLLYIYTQITKSISGGTKETWFVRMPFALYLGWISVAAIANISQVLFFFNWNAWGIPAATWTLIMLSIATILGLLMIWKEKEIVYSAVLVWAFIGISVSQADTILFWFTVKWKKGH
ncbi:MAG: hypothetical protein JEZ06_18360 [Anaerolineaceae bacterium]|nr:hypothetical protein [Anaerolineaceae bacterium]